MIGEKMDYLNLDRIIVKNNIIKYVFSYSNGISKFFSGKPFFIEYPELIDNVPESILAIPFVCNVLPIIWLTDSILEIDEIDKSFYESIPEFEQGYIDMYPNVRFGGEIRVKKIIDNSYSDTGKSAMFYSGGLDSASTLVSHFDEKPDLLSVWGSDIRFDNESGWKIVHAAINEAAERFKLKEAVFRSTFREFDNEGKLHEEFLNVLGDGWWHGIKHSLALLGHVAPYTFIHKITKMYIASTLCKDYGFATCASVPEVDNRVEFSSCKVFHDGYKFSRQDKANNVVSFCNSNNTFINLHVCWISQTGSNCCMCEKCYRTIANLWAEGGEFKKFGFDCGEQELKMIPNCISKLSPEAKMQMYWWKDIQKRVKENIKELKHKPYYSYFRWIIKADFDYPESISKERTKPFKRLRSSLSKKGLYRKLHIIKVNQKNEVNS